jgi:hypothetical protein
MNNVTYQLEPGSLSNVFKMLDALDLKTKNEVLRNIHRKHTRDIRRAILAAAPRDREGRLKRNFATKTEKKFVGGILVGYTRDAYMARFIEKGTVIRQSKTGASKGRIAPAPFIKPLHDLYTPFILQRITADYEKEVTQSLQKVQRRLQKKLAKLNSNR